MRITPKARWLLLPLALGALTYGGWRIATGRPVDVVRVVRGEIVQTVVASGRVVAPLRVDIGSQVTGAVVAVPVREGQDVETGQVLVQLADDEARANLAQARAAEVQARERLRQLQTVQLPQAEQAQRQAEATAAQARSQYRRTEELFKSGFVGQAALDDARRNMDVAESQARAAKVQVTSSRQGGADLAVASSALEQATAALRVAQVRLDYTVIRAPARGTLIARNVERGDIVQPGKVLMVLSPAGATQLVVQIDEKNLGRLAPGQHAMASADAYPERRFDAVLAYINPGVDPQRGSVEVKLDVAAPPPFLRQDMTVSVDIEVARRKDTLVLALDGVRDAASATPWVLEVAGGRARRVPIRIGVRGDSRVEILGGLDEGAAVVPTGSTTIRDGQRVRAR